MIRALQSISILLLILSAESVHADAEPFSPPRVAVFADGVRGVTVGPIESSREPGKGYGSPASELLVRELRGLGASWISVTPFGRIWSLDSTTIKRDFEAPYASNRAAVVEMIRESRASGLRVLLIPHLWVETTGWRGEIDPGTPEGWRRYIAEYRAFVTEWAAVAEDAGADAFSIGVECKSWSGRFGSDWARLIGDVRATFHGPLTYSANWDEAENVIFWDQLDAIGVNAFYPLADHDGASFEEYVAGAERARDRVLAHARIENKPVLFVEIGYTTRPNAAVQPWLWPDGMEGVVVDEGEQERALEALIQVFAAEPWFLGFFVWRYYASLDDVSQEAAWGFSPHGKRAELALAHAFTNPWASDQWVRESSAWLYAKDVSFRGPWDFRPPLFCAPSGLPCIGMQWPDVLQTRTVTRVTRHGTTT